MIFKEGISLPLTFNGLFAILKKIKEGIMNNHVEVQFGKWIEGGFNLYKENLTTLVLAAIILVALSALTMLILMPPLTAGFILLTLRMIDRETPPPGATAIFNGFSCFFNALMFMLIWGIVMMAGFSILGWFPFIGQLASLFFCYSLQALLVFGLFLIAEQNMGFWPASTQSMDIVKANFWPFLGLTIVSSVIGGIGFIVFGVGVVLTLPIHFCIMTVAYREVFTRTNDAPKEISRLETTP